MKKICAIACWSLAGLGLLTGQASAWFGCGCCCKAKATISGHQYNAFSPFCYDCVNYTNSCGPFLGPQPAYYPPACCDGGNLGQLPPAESTPGAKAPAAPGFQAPMPTPAPAPMSNPLPIDGGMAPQAWQSGVPYGASPPMNMQPFYHPGYNYGPYTDAPAFMPPGFGVPASTRTGQ
jgi:hypothetical protein